MKIKFLKAIVAVATIIAIALIVFAIAQRPSHDRVWKEHLTRLPAIEFFDEKVLVRDVRDWRYDSQGPIEKRWINRTININDIVGVWLVVEPFAGWSGVAHTMFVFDIANDEPVVVSAEARMEADEEYKASLGFLNKYELSYLWGTEQDMLARRVVLQKNKLYMYPLSVTEKYARDLFKELIIATNDLYQNPRFYNTVTENCTNVIADTADKADPGTVPWNIARILPGYSDRFLYKMGYINATGTLPELRERFSVTDIIASIDLSQYEEFSKILREQMKK